MTHSDARLRAIDRVKDLRVVQDGDVFDLIARLQHCADRADGLIEEAWAQAMAVQRMLDETRAQLNTALAGSSAPVPDVEDPA